MSFHCSTCGISFSDSLSAASHQASRMHKKRSGELAQEQRQYGKDSDVTVADVDALMKRKAQEMGLRPWSELRVAQ